MFIVMIPGAAGQSQTYFSIYKFLKKHNIGYVTWIQENFHELIYPILLFKSLKSDVKNFYLVRMHNIL